MQWSLANDGVDQIALHARRGGYEHFHFTKAATLVGRGEKFVAVLSRFPLLSRERIEHSHYPDGGGYATLHAKAEQSGRVMYAQWAPGSGWPGWTPFDVDYGSTQGLLNFAFGE